jgi:hypothetical protein
MNRTTVERDKRLDQLALRVGKLFDGEDLLDVASVCSLVIARALADAYGADLQAKDRALGSLVQFIQRYWQ